VLIDRQGAHGGFLVVVISASAAVVVTLLGTGILRADGATPHATEVPAPEPAAPPPAAERRSVTGRSIPVEAEACGPTGGSAVASAQLSECEADRRADQATGGTRRPRR
jgi:hypothetical protein